MPTDCTIAERLLTTYVEAQTAFDEADRSVSMNESLSDTAYIAAFLIRRKAEKMLLGAMRAYGRHLERHHCESGLFTDVA